MFRFGSPEYLWLLLLAPLLAGVFVLYRQGSRKRLARFLQRAEIVAVLNGSML